MMYCQQKKLFWEKDVRQKGFTTRTSRSQKEKFATKARRHAKGREDEVFIIKSFCGGSKRLKIRRWEGRKVGKNGF